MRTLIADFERRAAASAIFGIFIFLGVPLDYLSIRIWRTQHPQPVIFGGQNSGLEPTMLKVFLFCGFLMSVFMVFLVAQRYRVESVRYRTEELKLAADEQEELRSSARGSAQSHSVALKK